MYNAFSEALAVKWARAFLPTVTYIYIYIYIYIEREREREIHGITETEKNREQQCG